MEITPREIKFRAWDKNGDGMFYNVEQGISFDDGSKYDFHQFIEPLSHDIHEWVLMQYTGLKDKNGKEIYEGDIIQNVADDGSRLSVFEVLYDLNRVGFCKHRIETNDRYMLEHSRFYEIIGNIFSDPELLKQLDNGKNG